MRTILLFLSAACLACADGKAANRDADLRKTIAAGVAELAEWCVPKKLAAEGRALADEALGLDGANAKAKAAKEKLAGESAAGEAERKELESKKSAWGKKIAPLYRELAAQKHAAKDDAAYDAFLVKAYEWDAKGSGPAVDAAWRGALGKKEWERAHRILSGMERLGSDPARAKALRDCELRVAEKVPVLKQASGHRMQYWLVLPKDWTPAKKWPVMVYVEGAGCNFLGAIKNYAESRGDFNTILVVPQTLGSTNGLAEQKAKFAYDVALLEEFEGGGRMKFDEEGLLCVLEDLRKEYNAEEKIFITGFSGGGNLTWQMVFCHPEMVVAAAPACPNFYPHNLSKISEAAEREQLPVKVFQGDKDEYIEKLLEPQWVAAKKICDEKGWKNVTRVMLPGVGHSSCVGEVLAFFKPFLKR